MCECESVKVKSGAAKVKNNPPEGLPSMSLEGGSQTGASDELGRVPNDETTILQSTWMLRHESPSSEVHGVARSHEEAAGVDIKGGEAGERTCTGDDEKRRACERIDDRETGMAGRQVDDKATDTPNPHAKCIGPTRPVGTSHDPADELFGEREGGRVAESESESVSTPIEGRSGRMATDCADEPKELGDDPSDMASPDGKPQHQKAQVAGETSEMREHASIEEAECSVSAHRRSTTYVNTSQDDKHAPKTSPKPPKPPDNPAQRQTKSPSVELEGERRAASSCDVERTRAQADASGAPGHDGDDWERPIKLQTTSGHVSERLKMKGREDLPGRMKVKPGDPGCEADASSAPWSIERVLKRPKKLANASECANESSKRRTRRYLPGRAQVELGDPSSEADASRASGRAKETREKPTKLHNVSVQVCERSKRRR